MGLSKEMGALVAGLSISVFPYSIHVTAKTLPLRDFFLTLFFVSLGMKITAPTWGMVGPVLGVVAFVAVSRFASIYPLIAMTGGGRRAAFVASINLAQISEFSLVIATLGVSYGHISRNTVAITLYAMAIMAVMSSYAIRYSHPLYMLFERLTGNRQSKSAFAESPATSDADVVLLGYHRAARALVDALEKKDPHMLNRLLVIDFNPVSLDELKARGIAGLFGDISSMETLKHAEIGHAKYIVSTIPDLLLKGVDNLQLVRMCKAISPRAKIIATADDAAHEQRLRTEGARAVVRMYEVAGDALSELVIDTDSDNSPKHEGGAINRTVVPAA
jgi:hypothetical protein